MRAGLFLFSILTSFASMASGFAQSETDPVLTQAIATTKPQRDAMFLCFNTAAIKFAVQTCESATIVVEAAYGACHQAQEQYVAALTKSLKPLNPDAIPNAVAEIKSELRETLLSTVLKARIDSGRCQANSN